MPIYEFYCQRCHTIYNFFSRTINTSKRPSCPRCGRPRLERRVSRFAISKGLSEPTSDSSAEDDDLPLPPGVDEAKLERAFMELADEAEHLDEENPRQMASLMRKLFDKTGLPLGEAMQEAIRRMEAGEDPDQIEEELGDQLEQEEESLFGQADQPAAESKSSSKPAATQPKRTLRELRNRLLPPRVDETLYDL